MSRLLSLIALVLLAGLGWVWFSGGFDRLGYWASLQQRGFQNDLAQALRATRAGEAGAVLGVIAACFAYGLAHAAGPGHGKVLIGGYGLARQVAVWRLSSISLAASLGQALTAIGLVYGGIWLLGLGRQSLVDVTEGVMAPVGYAAIALIGLWLFWRGAARAWRNWSHQGHNHSAGDATCDHCGHVHGPSLDQVEKAGSLRDALVLIAGIAVRPCTGALFVLILTWQMGIASVGLMGTIAMALGTAIITIAVGIGATGLRSGLLAGWVESPRWAQVTAFVECLAGTIVVVLAGGLLLRAL